MYESVSESDAEHNSGDDEDKEQDSDREGEIIPVNFDFFGLVDTDFHAVKRFLTNALGPDAGDHLSGLVDLTDLILDQPFGSGVKCDGENSDPYAVNSVVGLSGKSWKDHKTVGPLRDFILSRTSPSCSKLTALLEKSSSKSAALLLHERLINMPWQIGAPLFRLLMEELQEAADDEKQYKFDYLIALCPMYRPEEDEGEQEPAQHEDDSGSEDERDRKRQRKEDIRARLMGKKGKGAAAAGKAKKAEKKAKKAAEKQAEELAAHAFLELEYLEQFAEFTFTLKHTLSKADDVDNLATFDTVRGSRRGIVFATSKLPELVATLEKLVEENEQLINQERGVLAEDDD
ncbi:p21-C-terminal region-binding protein-domain-containing protein, partial [Catenaria anguillulae PL171]